MEKKLHSYHLTVASLTEVDQSESKKLEFDFGSHDEIFAIIDKLKASDPFHDETQAIQFAIGLKLFSEVMLKHRDLPLFEELKVAFPAFMKKLKSL